MKDRAAVTGKRHGSSYQDPERMRQSNFKSLYVVNVKREPQPLYSLTSTIEVKNVEEQTAGAAEITWALCQINMRTKLCLKNPWNGEADSDSLMLMSFDCDCNAWQLGSRHRLDRWLGREFGAKRRMGTNLVLKKTPWNGEGAWCQTTFPSHVKYATTSRVSYLLEALLHVQCRPQTQPTDSDNWKKSIAERLLPYKTKPSTKSPSLLHSLVVGVISILVFMPIIDRYVIPVRVIAVAPWVHERSLLNAYLSGIMAPWIGQGNVHDSNMTHWSMRTVDSLITHSPDNPYSPITQPIQFLIHQVGRRGIQTHNPYPLQGKTHTFITIYMLV